MCPGGHVLFISLALFSTCIPGNLSWRWAALQVLLFRILQSRHGLRQLFVQAPSQATKRPVTGRTGIAAPPGQTTTARASASFSI